MRLLKLWQIDFTMHTHPPLRTVEDAKLLRGNMPGMHIKNLYLRDRKKRSFLVVSEEDKLINLKIIDKQIGCDRLSFGSADRLFEMLGVRPGAVSPLALINDQDQMTELVLDADLIDQPYLYMHPLVNDVTLRLTSSGFMQFLLRTAHKPKILNFC